MPITTVQDVDLFRVGLMKATIAANEKEQNWYDSWVRMKASKSPAQRFERLYEQTGLGFAEATGEGQPGNYDLWQRVGSKDFYPTKYTISIAVTEEAIYEDVYNLVAERAAMLSFSMSSTKDQVAANFFNGAFTNTYINAETAFSFTHTGFGGAANISNRGDGTNDLAMTAANVEIAGVQQMLQKNRRGHPAPTPGPFYIISNPSLTPLATRICNSQNLQGTANNDTNEYNRNRFIPFDNPYISSTTNWFVVPRDKTKHGIIMIGRKPIYTLRAFDFENEVHKIKMGEEYVMALEMFNRIWGSNS